MPRFIVQMAEDEYRIVGPGGEEGSCAAYGQAAALAIGANGDTAFYYALVEEPNEVKEGDTVEVYRVDSATAFTAGTDEVEFADNGSGIALVDEEDDEDEDETV